MSNPVLNQCWPLKMPPTAKAVLISMADQADDAGHCWPSIQTLSDRTCVSKRAVIDAIKWLERSSALVADRTNGRHTKYKLTPAQFDASPMQSIRSEARKTSADAAPVPVQMPHQPVQMPHTNPQEPPFEPSITPKPRAKRFAADSPDGFAEFWAQYPKKEARQVAAMSWARKRLHEDLPLRERVMAALAVHRKLPQWTKDGGKYVPQPSTWLNQERWTDEVGAVAQPGSEAVLGHPIGSDAYLLANRNALWWRDAGFENVWEAANARCWHTNARKFRDGRLIPENVGVPA